MAFDPGKIPKPRTRRLPVILLLDVSGSMQGEKINTLYDSVVDMVDSFVEAQRKETMIDVAIFTFGREVALHTPYTAVTELQKTGIGKFVADGMTPMGLALEQAKLMIEDKETTSGHNYRPSVVLVSDGQPNDRGWEKRLQEFICTGRSSRTQRFAIAIGNDADRNMLELFTGIKENVFFAESAAQIADCFEKFTMSVSTRAASKTPDAIPMPSNAQSEKYVPQGQVSGDDDDDDEFI